MPQYHLFVWAPSVPGVHLEIWLGPHWTADEDPDHGAGLGMLWTAAPASCYLWQSSWFYNWRKKNYSISLIEIWTDVRCSRFISFIFFLFPSFSLSAFFSGWFLFHIKTFHNQPSYWLISILIIANEFKCPNGIPFCCANYCWINRVLLGIIDKLLFRIVQHLYFMNAGVRCWGGPLFVLIYNGHWRNWGMKKWQTKQINGVYVCSSADANDIRKLKWQFAYFPFKL